MSVCRVFVYVCVCVWEGGYEGYLSASYVQGVVSVSV